MWEGHPVYQTSEQCFTTSKEKARFYDSRQERKKNSCCQSNIWVNPFLNSLPLESIAMDFWAFTTEARHCFCPVTSAEAATSACNTVLFRPLPKRKYQAGQKSCYECSGQSLPEVYRFWVFQFWNTIWNVLENQITSCKPQFCKSSPFWRSLTFSFQKSLDTSMHTYVHTCDCMRVHMWEAEQPSS